MKRFPLTAAALVSAAALLAAGCGEEVSAPDGPEARSEVQASRGGNGDPTAEAEIERLLNALFPPKERAEPNRLFARVKERMARGDTAGARETTFELLELVLESDLRDPSGETTEAEATAELLDLLFTFVGLEAPELSSALLAGEVDGTVEVTGPEGKTVVSGESAAGVALPQGAVGGDVLLVVERVEPKEGEACLPTDRAQRAPCYRFETFPGLGEVNGEEAFRADVTVGVCLDASGLSAPRTLHFRLFKHDPERPELGVVRLPTAGAGFLNCGGPDGSSVPRGGVTRSFSTVGSASTLTQITTNAENQWLPVVDGDRIGWIDERIASGCCEPRQLRVFDLSEQTEYIVTDSVEQDGVAEPGLSGDRVLWVAPVGELLESGARPSQPVTMFDIAAGTQTEIFSCSDQNQPECGFGRFPVVSGDRVAWQTENIVTSDVGVWTLDLSTSSAIAIDVDHKNSLVGVAVDGDLVAWVRYDSDESTRFDPDQDLFVYDAVDGVITEIPTEGGKIRLPDVSGDRITWQEEVGGNFEIFVFDLSTATRTQLTSDGVDQWQPSIDGDRIVYADPRNGNWDVFLFDLSEGTEYQLTDDPDDSWNPHISGNGNRIVWTDTRTGNLDIWMLEL